MARAIILSFKDNAAAEKFIRDLDDAVSEENASPSISLTNEAGMLAAAFGTVEAMVARPTIACHCTKGLGLHGSKGTGYTKTKLFGWWIHAECKKPSPPLIHNFIRNMIVGVGNDLVPGLREKWKGETEPALANSGDSGPVENIQAEAPSTVLENNTSPD
jgi:hypothetical protein